MFPHCICLDIGPADFVDTSEFKPLNISKIYDGIQISHWTNFKRPEMFIEAAGLLPKRNFLKLGHFERGGSPEEYQYRDSNIALAKKIGANITFPFSEADSNSVFPNSKEEMNYYINSAKLGILTTKVEGINRFKMECLSAGIPFIVPKDTSYPTKKHINSETGLEFEPTPKGLANAIENVLTNIKSYNPRRYIERVTGKIISLNKLKIALETICERDKVQFKYENIDWDGRNQSLIWGNNVFKELRRYQTDL